MTTILETLKNNLVFQDFTDDEYAQIVPLFEPVSFEPNTIFIEQDAPPDDLFIITQGSVAILKRDANHHLHRISQLSAGDMIGEIAFFDKSPRSASVKTLEKTTLLKLNVEKFAHVLQNETIYKKLYRNLAKHYSIRLRHTNDTVVASLQSDLKRAENQINMGNLMVTTLVILTLFIFSLNIIQQLSQFVKYSTIITLPLLILVLVAVCVNIKLTGYPLSFYGVTLKNSSAAIPRAILYTLPLLAVITFFKWLAIQTIPTLSNEPLFRAVTIFVQTDTGKMFNWIPWAYVFLSVPIQELIFRGTLQASLKEFLVSKHHIGLSIFVSNLIFAMMHIAVSMILAGFAFVLGLFWGLLYNRYQALSGVVVSHMLIGGWVFFVLGIESILPQL